MIESDDEQDGSVSRILREKYGMTAKAVVMRILDALKSGDTRKLSAL